MKLVDMILAINSVECGNFRFILHQRNNDNPYMQIQCDDVCTRTGDEYIWKGRKWLLSFHMTKSEIIQTCFLAAKTAMTHELHETFKYRGQPIFRPHFDVDVLHHLSEMDAVDARQPS